jgi:hypothetical protein
MAAMSRASPSLRMPTISVAVDLASIDGQVRRYEVCVAPHQEHAYRRQHLIDLLEVPSGFMPARDVVEDRWVLVNKATLVWAAVPLTDGALPIEEEAESFEPQLYDVQAVVTIELAAHPVIEGQVLYSPPADHARVADYLNQSGRFFRLWATERLYLINKDHVIRVHEAPEE